MVGDYYRYMGETAQGDKLKQVTKDAQLAYDKANLIDLPQLHPIKIGLTLNYTVLLHDILQDYDKGIKMAQEAVQLEEDFKKLPQAK